MMKNCPYCAEEIQDDAIKCRFCQEFLVPQKPKPQGSSKWFFSTSSILVSLLVVGPFALPLIWFNPSYKKSTKLIWTIVIVALSVVLYLLIQALYAHLMQQLKKLGIEL